MKLTREEMREIESSARLYEDGGALFLTATVVTKLDTDLPESTQVTFILANGKLVTNRYTDPLPFRRFIAYAERHPNSCNSPPAVLAGLLESIINRVADVIERVATDLNAGPLEVARSKGLGSHVRFDQADAFALPAHRQRLYWSAYLVYYMRVLTRYD